MAPGGASAKKLIHSEPVEGSFEPDEAPVGIADNADSHFGEPFA
jgi:hypothetical protein